MNSSSEVRNTFLKFFEEKEHRLVSSAPIVVKDDPTLMFTNAGMNQFKDIFLDLKKPVHPRVADTQKCLRVSGKHNDLEEVGHDTYHHTMFEMLGNWSFGDYYKTDAIDWAWELLTDIFQLSTDRLYATVFGGDDELGLGVDTEARDIWAKHLPAAQILNFGRKDNFWMMGDTGPCGPCSEIHIDLRSDEERAKLSGAELVNRDHPQVVEIWNLVFMQYNAKADGSLEPLPQTHVDTGMGFERILMVLQNKTSTYDTDLFEPFRKYLEARTGKQYEAAEHAVQVAMRVVMDHLRAICFAIADGQVPSNTGAGYVIRRILRRANRYAYRYLGIDYPFLHDMVKLLVKKYNDIFPELEQQQDFLEKIIREEEKSFLDKLARGEQMFESYLKEHPDEKSIDPEFAFKLYDTYGFPIDLTELMAREAGRTIDLKAFEALLAEQKERSRAATQLKTGDWTTVKESNDLPVFRGYDTLELETEILSFRTVEQKKKRLYQVVLAETPFYAESGGQVGDRGIITNGTETLQVIDTRRENELIVHFTNKLPSEAEGSWTARVDRDFRQRVMLNHSATHLLHAALRDELGSHVEQRGSLVSDKLLRFDFSHFERVSPEQLKAIESQVNQKIAEGIALEVRQDVPLEQAREMGAMALFGEKYGERVRVVVFDPEYSVELCGGTHVNNTRDIRLFTFVSEGSSAAGIRRVEALTGQAALAHLQAEIEVLDQLRNALKNPKDPVRALEDVLAHEKRLEKKVETYKRDRLQQLKSDLLGRSERRNGIHIIRQRVPEASADDLRQLAFDLKGSTENTLIVLGTEQGGKAILTIILTDDLKETGKYNASQLVRELAKEIKGGGGGQPFFATAGGKDPAGLDRALARVEELI